MPYVCAYTFYHIFFVVTSDQLEVLVGVLDQAHDIAVHGFVVEYGYISYTFIWSDCFAFGGICVYTLYIA